MEFEENFYRQIIETLQEGIWIIDENACTTFVNPHMAEMLGYTVEEMQGKHLFSLMDERGLELCTRNLERRRQGIKEQHDFEFMHKDGRRIYTSLATAPFYDEDGKYAGAIAGVQNITERIATEEVLRESERRVQEQLDELEHIYRTAPVGLCLLDRNLRYVRVNEQLAGYNGRTVAEHLGRTVREVLPDYAEEIEVRCRQVLDSGEPILNVETVGPLPSNPGKQCWWWVSYHPFKAYDGDIQGLSVVVVDMTEQKQTEESLRASNERFLELSENLDEVFWIATLDRSRIIYVNRAFERIWGASCEGLYDDPETWFNPLHHDDRHLASGGFERFRNEVSGTKEYRIVRRDGSIRWIRDRWFPIRNASGEVCRVAGIAADITDERMLRQESEQRLQQIIQADKLASLGEVVAGAVHEINNPNSFICYNLPLLEETWQMFEPLLAGHARTHPDWRRRGLTFGELCEDMKEIIKAIRTGSDRINKVVTDLKDFSRVDESTRTKPVHVNEVVERAMTIAGAQVRKSAATVRMNLEADLPLIQGHFFKLEQVVVNLLINASQAISEKDRGRILARTRYVERLRSVLIEVEDNGAGMSPEVMNRIFDPFFTTKRGSGGTGLGLSVSYGLVQEHHGIIGVLSRLGLGSRFTVILPVDQGMRLDLSPLILCIDDEVPFLNMLDAQFVRIKKAVKTLSDPEQVLTLLEEHPEVDIVLCDIKMPGLNGWEVLNRVKSRFPLLAVVLYSGDVTALKPDSPQPHEPDYLLAKPFRIKDLATLINRIERQLLCGF